MNICYKKQAMCLFLLCTLFMSNGWAQPDSLQIASPDSVTFTADEVAYNVETKQIELIGNATLHYREMQLQAGHILFD